MILYQRSFLNQGTAKSDETEYSRTSHTLQHSPTVSCESEGTTYSRLQDSQVTSNCNPLVPFTNAEIRCHTYCINTLKYTIIMIESEHEMLQVVSTNKRIKGFGCQAMIKICTHKILCAYIINGVLKHLWVIRLHIIQPTKH